MPDNIGAGPATLELIPTAQTCGPLQISHRERVLETCVRKWDEPMLT